MVMKMINLKNILLCSLLIISNLSANEQVNTKENYLSEQIDADQNQISDADLDTNFSEETINDWISDFEDKLGITIGEAFEGRTFFSGSSIVNVGPLDPAYGKELTFAYQKAFLSLQADFILQTYGNMASEKIMDYFEDDSTNSNEFPPAQVKKDIKNGKLDEVLDKALTIFGNVYIGKLLATDGKSKDEIEKLSVKQKKILFKDNFKQKMVKKAFKSLSGLVPVQTKVITRKTPVGDVVEIGIIAVMSEKTVQFARDMAKQRPTNIKGKPKNIRDVLPKKKDDYLNEFGLRYLYDNQGRPMLLSYGRWSVTGKTNNPKRYAKKINSAKRKARLFAEAAIGEFMKSNIQASESLEAESISEEILEKVTTFKNGENIGSNKSNNEISDTLDTYFQKISSKSEFELRGSSQLKTWDIKDKNGIVHVGAVVTWTYEQLDNANNIAKGKFKKNSEIKKEQRIAKKESRSSVLVNDLDDF